MDQGDTVIAQDRFHLLEILLVMGHAHMLEHADGDDPVECLGDIAIIGEAVVDLVHEAHLFGLLAGIAKLVLREGDAGDLHIRILGEEAGHAAPAAADIQHFLPRFQGELGGDMRHLLHLRLFQAVIRRLVIGAGILPVLIKEQVIEVIAQVIMMGDILERAAFRVELVEEPVKAIGEIAKTDEQVALSPADIAGEEVQQIVDIAVLQRELPVHIGFAEIQLGEEGKLAGHGFRMQAHFDDRAGSAAVEEDFPAIRINHRELALPDEAFEDLR